MVEVPERVTTDFSDRLFITITVRQTVSRPWYSGFYQLSSTHPSGKESCHSGQFYPAIQHDGKTIYKARNILFTAKCLPIVSTEYIAVSRLSEAKFTDMLFHRFLYSHIGCLLNQSFLILTFYQTVVLLFFYWFTHCFSFNTYRPLIQCWWWAHPVSMGCPFSTFCESGANALSLSPLYDGYIGRQTNRTMDTPTLWREYRQRPVVMAPQSMWYTPKNTKNTHKNRNFAQYLYKYC